MQVFQQVFAAGERIRLSAPAMPVQLVLVFGSTDALSSSGNFAAIRAAYPEAVIAGCSTAGQIHGTSVTDDTLAVTAIAFDYTTVAIAASRIDDMRRSRACGEALVKALPSDQLRHVLVFSDGLNVNGTDLVRGITGALPPHVIVTGGLSADGERFQHTLVCANDVPSTHTIAAIGFYGPRIRIGYGSYGGWNPFGPDRVITRSKGNVLYDLDGQPALQLYKKYLGEHARGLPATALLFPLMLHGRDGEKGVVRTILGIDEADQSMTFAGDMPEGCKTRLMWANLERLIDGAHEGALIAAAPLQQNSAQFALLISCVGRKLVLKQQVEEEVECVQDVLGRQAALAGFYSYGEISPHSTGERCELHNQTMTITTFAEI